MRTRIVAVLELLLLFPAALFMTALVVRELQPLQTEPAHSAQQLVMWYAARMWTLWVLLLALPLAALITGGATMLREWDPGIAPLHAARELLAAIRARSAMIFVAAETLTAAGNLVIVVLHMMAN